MIFVNLIPYYRSTYLSIFSNNISLLPYLVAPTETSSVQILEEDVVLTTAESATVPTGKSDTLQICVTLIQILKRRFIVT